MRLLITASRNFHNLSKMLAAVQPFAEAGPLTIVHGDARGGDQVAEQVADICRANVYRFPAEWDALGRSAGPIRNREMLDTMQPDHVLAFPLPGSIGTVDMINEARRRGIPTTVVP